MKTNPSSRPISPIDSVGLSHTSSRGAPPSTPAPALPQQLPPQDSPLCSNPPRPFLRTDEEAAPPNSPLNPPPARGPRRALGQRGSGRREASHPIPCPRLLRRVESPATRAEAESRASGSWSTPLRAALLLGSYPGGARAGRAAHRPAAPTRTP